MDHKELIEKCDNLRKNADHISAYKLLLPLKSCNDVEILWRLSQSLHDSYYNKPSSSESKTKIAEALKYATRALEIDEKSYEAHIAAAALLDMHYKNISVKARVEQSLVIRDHMIRAAELKPNEPQGFYMLGWWYWAVADLPWAIKKLTKVVFSTMLEGSFEQSLSQFEAVLEKPNAKDYINYSMALTMSGKCHMKINNEKKALQFFRQALQTPIRTEVDKEAHEEAKRLLNQYI